MNLLGQSSFLPSESPWSTFPAVSGALSYLRFGRLSFGSMLLEPELRSVSVVVGNMRSNYLAVLRLIDRDHVVEAFFP
jgi:hypothetical protein